MARITRPEMRPQSGPCVNCKKKTRSHVLELAEYEEYMQEVVVGRSDLQARKGWEDVEEQLRSEIVVEALVMCHECWTGKEKIFHNKIQKHWMAWDADPIANAASIRKAMETLQYYEFVDLETVDILTRLVKKLKAAVLND